MSDYIKREDAIKTIEKIIIGAMNIALTDEAKRKAAEALFADIPSADVVEVVRCKDCKHKYIDENGTYQCPFGLTGGEMFYCSYGERK